MRIKAVNYCVVAVAIATLSAAGVAAQSTRNLSGTWTLDAAKSDPLPAPQAGGRGRGNQSQMVITQSSTEITIAVGGANYIYNLDGSERTGPPGGETRSKITWDGGTLVVTWKREFFAGPEKGYLTSTGKDTYVLDGSVLTVERTTVQPSQPPQTRKAVYVRTP
jgi:hypothetical protein